jgi:hypothetical protein
MEERVPEKTTFLGPERWPSPARIASRKRQQVGNETYSVESILDLAGRTSLGSEPICPLEARGLPARNLGCLLEYFDEHLSG